MSHRSTDPSHPEPRERRPAGHLPPERLAALADAEPAAAEAAHLAACAPCTTEREAHRALLAAARRERDRVAPPLTDWTALSTALRGEGLLHGDAALDAVERAGEVGGVAAHAISEAPSRRRRGLPGWAARIAAALLLTAGGVAAGRASAGAPVLPAAVALGGEAAADARVRAILADSAQTPQSQADAIAVLRRAERDYRLATQWLAERTTTGAGVERPEDYQRRLAVMDEVASLTGAALNEAPHDPVLNQYYLASLSAREATLRQLGTVLPAGAQLNGF
jgi:hypothetical protein